mgnify:CR=1 FL=1
MFDFFKKKAEPEEDPQFIIGEEEPDNFIMIEYDKDEDDVVLTCNHDPEDGMDILINLSIHLLSGRLDSQIVQLLEQYVSHYDPTALESLSKGLIDEISSKVEKLTEVEDINPIIGPFGYSGR